MMNSERHFGLRLKNGDVKIYDQPSRAISTLYSPILALDPSSGNYHPKTIVYHPNVEYIAWLNTLHLGSAFGMKLRIQLGLNIQEARRSKGFSQETLAHRADIDRGYIGKIENAKHAATIDMVEAIAGALDIEAQELLKPRN